VTVWIQNPFDNLPGEGFRKMRYALMAEAFVRAGHDVVVWTSDFSHATKRRRALSEEAQDGVAIRLVGTLPYFRNVSFRRVASHVAYARRFEREAMRAVAEGMARPGLVVTSFPTISAAEASVRLARRLGAKSVVDVQDAWPETFERILPRWALAPLRAKARRLFREADFVTGVCDRYRELTGRSDYRRAYLGIEPGPCPEPPRSRTGRGRIAYVGGVGRTYDLDTVRRAAESLGMDLAVAGGANYLGRRELEEFLAGCDVGVIPMRDDSWVGLPNKLFDYAKAGLPVASSLGGETAALLEKYACGATYRSGDAGSLAEAVRAALRCEAMASRRMCEAEFSAGPIYDEYARVLV
jgi:glycosyltransferase involved in cell wall biosynthesis